ncbi:mannose-specific lectin 3-like [Musa acuminata AAA Group]|uniref:mannose-specific lectin 3-like n=1 Tax=Musa acuminata AAA Group TaxID=214697 RepID=UPI0031E0660F
MQETSARYPARKSMAMPRVVCALLFVLYALSRTSPSTAHDNNIMLTGDVLCPDCQLSYLDATFTMQSDCNLVFYEQSEATFYSDTYDQGHVNCTVSLNQYGQLVISAPDGTTVWTSGTPASEGRYAAVLRPDKQVGIYGPVVWSAPDTGSASDVLMDDGEEGESDDDVIPTVDNTLFSSDILGENEGLATRDYSLTMLESCSLELVKGESQYLWVSGSVGRGKHCFLRLNRMGQLTIKDDEYQSIWSTKPSPRGDGDYVLILQSNGQAAVYGPLIWATGGYYQTTPFAFSPAPISY